MISTSTVLDDLWELLTDDQQRSMNRDAFNDIARVYLDFIHAHRTGKPKSTHWVCDAAPGHGKTTVLKCVLKSLAQAKMAVPLLLVFNNKDTMNEFYWDMKRYSDEINKDDLIQRVHAENVRDVEGTLKRFLYVCITQQRLRNLALGIGSWKEYGQYQPGG